MITTHSIDPKSEHYSAHGIPKTELRVSGKKEMAGILEVEL